MRLIWDAAPGPVRRYLITYKPEDGEAKEVSLVPVLFSFPFFTYLKLLNIYKQGVSSPCSYQFCSFYSFLHNLQSVLAIRTVAMNLYRYF